MYNWHTQEWHSTEGTCKGMVFRFFSKNIHTSVKLGVMAKGGLEGECWCEGKGEGGREGGRERERWSTYLDQLLSHMFHPRREALHDLPCLWSCRLPQQHKSGSWNTYVYVWTVYVVCVCVCVCMCACACVHVYYFAHHVWSHCQNIILIHCVYLLVNW